MNKSSTEPLCGWRIIINYFDGECNYTKRCQYFTNYIEAVDCLHHFEKIVEGLRDYEARLEPIQIQSKFKAGPSKFSIWGNVDKAFYINNDSWFDEANYTIELEEYTEGEARNIYLECDIIHFDCLIIAVYPQEAIDKLIALVNKKYKNLLDKEQ